MVHGSSGGTGGIVPASASGESLRELPIMVEGDRETTCHMVREQASVGRCHTLLNNQISQKLRVRTYPSPSR